MAGITLVQNSGLTALFNHNPALTGVAGGNTLILTIVYVNSNTGQAAITPTISDSAGGTWIQAVAPTQEHTYGTEWQGSAIFYLPNAAAGAHTATITAANNFWIAGLTEWSGMPTTASLDKTMFGGVAVAGAMSGSTGNTATTTIANELLIAVFGGTFNGGTTNAAITDPPAGYTSLGAYQTTSTDNIGVEFCYQVVSSTGVFASNWTWTDTTNASWQGVIATFTGNPVGSTGSRLSLMGVG